MTIGIGIIGLGFMGKMHFDTYSKMKGVKIAAIADLDARKRAGDWSGILGNIGGAGKRQNLKGINVYADASELLRDPAVDVVDITLPTFLHASWTIRAFQAGRHVICEKPMALKSTDAQRMISAAHAARRQLLIGQCIRFWPAYTKARELVRSNAYGRVQSAVFTRVSTRPTWSWQNWLLAAGKSGGCAMDLHIHDADFILYLLGRPSAVSSRALTGAGGLEHITTFYQYPGAPLIQTEGAWEYCAGFPFSMAFRIHMQKAALNFGADGLTLYPAKGRMQTVKTSSGTGYEHELKHFLDCVRNNSHSSVVPPESALESVRLIEAEMRSARLGRPVSFK